MTTKRKLLGIISHEDGWNGGQWLIKPKDKIKINLFSVITKQDKITLNILGDFFPAKLVEITGTDYDHGHSYEWIATDIIVSFRTGISVVESSLRQLLKQNKIKNMRIKIYVENMK